MAEASNSSAPAKVAAIVVTYNRLALLRECLAAIRGQTRKPDALIVINNSSTDGTTAWLQEQSDLTVITQPNLGSSGGQYAGIKEAYRQGHDWFWCMDDDTIPDADALEKLLGCPKTAEEGTGFLGSLVLGVDRKLFNSSFFLPTRPRDWVQSVDVDRCVAVDLAPFVSLLVARRAVAAVGLPIKSMFLIHDDLEFTRRISKRLKGWCVLNSPVVHKSNGDARLESIATWGPKENYGIRNFIYITRTADQGTSLKLLTLTNVFYHCLRGTVFRRRPLSCWLWFLRGLFYSPSVERP